MRKQSYFSPAYCMQDFFYKTTTMKKTIYAIAAICLLSACSNTAKKIVVLSKGDADINTDTKTIRAKDGTGHQDKTFTVTAEKVTYQIDAPAGKTSIDFTGRGIYVLNVKTDTIVGSLQHYNDATQAQAVVSQEELKQKIDSLQLLVEGKNISAANHNFFILPNTAAKITDNLDATIVTPYHQMLSVEKVDGKIPEVYRFYSIKETREYLEKLISLTIPKK